MEMGNGKKSRLKLLMRKIVKKSNTFLFRRLFKWRVMNLIKKLQNPSKKMVAFKNGCEIFNDKEYFIENSLTSFPPFLKKFFSKFFK